MADDSKEIIKAEKEQLGESKQQTKSLSDLVKDMKQQSKNVKESVTANVDVNRSIKGLEGFMGMDATEQTTALKEELKNLQTIMNGQIELQKQGLPFNQQLLDESQKQLEVLQAGVKSEEEKREAIKKQDEANSILMSMKSSFEKGLGKVKETGGFLAGIAGLATLVLNPELFAKAIQAVIGVVQDIVEVIDGFATGGLSGGLAKMKENFGAISILIGTIAIAKLGAVLGGLYKTVQAFKTFSKFVKVSYTKGILLSLKEKMLAMKATVSGQLTKVVTVFKSFRTYMTTTFIPTIISSLKSMMSSVGGVLIKGFNFLKNSFLVFKTFMLGTFIPNTISTLTASKAAVGGGLMKAFGFLQKAFMVFRGFMLTTVVPTMVGALTGISTAMAPMLAALTPILIPVLAIAGILAGLGFGLKKLQESMGFDSIMDTLKFSFMKFTDIFANIINKVKEFQAKILESKLARFFLGNERAEVAAKNIRDSKLDTNKAEKFKEQKLKETPRVTTPVDNFVTAQTEVPVVTQVQPTILPNNDINEMLEARRVEAQSQLDNMAQLNLNAQNLENAIPEVIAIKPEAIQPVENPEEKPRTLKGMFTQMEADSARRIENIKQAFAKTKEGETFGESFSAGMTALKNAVDVTASPEIKMEATEPTVGTQMAEMSAENLLANMPATTENNVVNQVSNQSTQNSGNTTTTIIQSSRPSRTADLMRSNRGSFAR